MLIDKIKPYNSKDLIPYYSKKDRKWGFFHRASKKRLTTPILREEYFFQPDLHFYYSFEVNGEDGCQGELLGSAQVYKLTSVKSSVYEIMIAEAPKKEEDINYKNFAKDDIPGFELDENGNLTYFNSKYYNKKEDKPQLSDIFKINGKHYATALYEENGKKYYTIINQKGEVSKGFEKLETYPNRKQIFSNENDVWFLLEIAKDKYIFKSLLTGQTFNETFDYAPSWKSKAQDIGYAIFSVNKQSGLLDLTTMQWIIKPSAKNDFVRLHYASSDPLNFNYEKDRYSYNPTVTNPIEMIHHNRSISYIYIQNSKKQFLDLNLKLYKPSR